MSELPDYVNDKGHGEICYAIPAALSEVTAYAFPLKTDEKKLQAFIDSQLNACSGGAVKFTALPFVIYACFNSKHCTSDTQVIGWVPDKEMAFVVPLLQHKKGELLPELTFWIPYLFMEPICGMVTGRENWGYRKMPGTLHVSAHPGTAAHFKADTMIFKTFSEATEGQWGTILENKGKSNMEELISVWDKPRQAFEKVLELIVGKIGTKLVIEAEEAIARAYGKPELPVVCLKQFRDAADSFKACYQALIHAPNRLDKWTGGGPLLGDFELTITTCDSHQIVNDLGLGEVGEESTTVKPLLGFWISMDFTALNGETIWQAPGTGGGNKCSLWTMLRALFSRS